MELRFKNIDIELRTPEEVQRITDLLNSSGARCYIIGGFTRDLLLGKNPKDLDIEVHGLTLDDLKKILESSGFTINEVGKSFGILKVEDRESGAVIDISVPRIDNTGRKPDITFIENPTPATAAARRDFTINAIMYDTKDDVIADPYQGISHLEEGIVQAVTHRSFTEDPLRIVRAAQFAARLGFSVEPGTVLSANRADTRTMAPERVTDELLKVFRYSHHPSHFFNCLDRMGQLKLLFPEIHALKDIPQDPLHHPEGNVYQHTMEVVDRAHHHDSVMMFVALLHDTGKKETTTFNTDRQTLQSPGHEESSAEIAKLFLQRYRIPQRDLIEIVTTVRHHMRPHHMVLDEAFNLKHKHRLMASLAGGYFQIMKDPQKAIERYNRVVDFAILDKNDERQTEKYQILRSLPPIEHYTPKVLGRDLLAKGYEGKELGRRLEQLYINQINTTKEDYNNFSIIRHQKKRSN
jgi:tRNA nucleotidyltransferase (CCA-adding enzyme)